MEKRLSQHVTTYTGVKLLVISMPVDSYRFTLVKNPELKGRYGNLEYTTKENGYEHKIEIDDIEKHHILGAIEKASGCFSGCNIKFLDCRRLVDSMFYPEAGKKDFFSFLGGELYYKDYNPIKNILNDFYLHDPDSSFITFLASKGMYVDGPYSKPTTQEHTVYGKLLVIEIA